MDFIFRWVAGALALILAKYANPKLQASLDAYNARVVQAEAAEKAAVEAEKQSQAAYAISVANRAGWDEKIKVAELQIEQSRARFEEAQERIRARDEETAKLNKAVLDRSDADAFGGGVPKSG